MPLGQQLAPGLESLRLPLDPRQEVLWDPRQEVPRLLQETELTASDLDRIQPTYAANRALFHNYFEARAKIFGTLADRMTRELTADPGSAPANYWLPVALRGAGELDAAWDAAIAGWVRVGLNRATASPARMDLDRLVTERLIADRANRRPAAEQTDAQAAWLTVWERVKQEWP